MHAVCLRTRDSRGAVRPCDVLAMVSQALVYRARDYQQGAVGGRHQQVQAREDHDTYAKAQDCAHIQPEGP